MALLRGIPSASCADARRRTPRSWAQLGEAGIAETAALRRRITGCLHRRGVDAPAQAHYGYLWWTGEYKEHAVFDGSGSYYQKIIGLPDVDVVVVVTAADDLTGVDTLGLTLDPVLEKVIFNPLLQ